MIPPTPVRPELVQHADALALMISDLGKQSRIAVDTESNSLHAYRERICVMQFSTADRDYVVDALAVGKVTGLRAVFGSDDIEKIFHAAEYDLICLRRDYGFDFSYIFDTMQAGRILGRKLAGLDRLLEEKFGVKVNKRLQKANWGARPLSPELLDYAAMDTHYLIPLREMLEVELRSKGLWDLAAEDFRMACQNIPASDGSSREPSGWTRLSTRRDLSSRGLTILRELLEWRESMAARLDRPPFKVIGDDKLLQIARANPASLEGLTAAGLTASQTRKWGGDLLRALSRGTNRPVIRKPRQSMPSGSYLKRLEKLKHWRKSAAARWGVESDVVLPRGLLLRLAEAGEKEVDAILEPSPWRRRRFGEQISAVLHSVAA